VDSVIKEAVISDDEMYRYRLSRTWSRLNEKHAVFVMLNPSTADERFDDPTIRRCINFAKREDCGGLIVVNLYAFRTPEPKYLKEAARAGIDTVGILNDYHLEAEIGGAAGAEAPLIAAWGTNAQPARVKQVMSFMGMETAKALKITKDGHPGHPLYVKSDAPLVDFP
jgi:hypothetical protein